MAAPLEDLRSAWRAVCEVGPQGYDAPYEDREAVDRLAGEGASDYGEILAKSAEALFAALQPTAADVLFDLGSGVGKLVFQAACTTAVGRAVGVELSEFRHTAALATRDAILAKLDPAGVERLNACVELRHEDLRATDVCAATIIFAGSTSFPPELLAALAERALTAPRLRALVSTCPLPDPWDQRFRERERMPSPMSWSSYERVVVYEPGT